MDLENLRDVAGFPNVLAAVIGGVALAALALTLITSLRRREIELAVLRAIGFDRRDVRMTLAAQVMTMVGVGIVVGVPIGLITGRVLWRVAAGQLAVVDHPDIPGLLIAGLAAAAVVLAALGSLAPAARVLRRPPAASIRA